MDQDAMEIQIRKLFLDFYTAQLATHARLIIGVTVLLFTIVDITLRLIDYQFKHAIPFTWNQCWLSLAGLFITSFFLWFLIFRDIIYGILANHATHFDIRTVDLQKDTNLTEATKYLAVVKDALSKRASDPDMNHIPVGWFASYGESPNRKAGVIICLVLAFFTTIVLALLIGMLGIAVWRPSG